MEEYTDEEKALVMLLGALIFVIGRAQAQSDDTIAPQVGAEDALYDASVFVDTAKERGFMV